MKKQLRTEKVAKKWPSGNRGKHHVDYWKSQITKLQYRVGEECREVSMYSVRIQHQRRRERFCLHAANKDQAAARAKRIYERIVGAGWDAAIKEFGSNRDDDKAIQTVGDYLRVAEPVCGVKAITFTHYKRKLRSFLASAFQIKSDKRKFDHHGKGAAEWHKKTDKILLAKLTDSFVERWINQTIRDCKDPLTAKRRQSTVHSIILACKALFGKKVSRRITAQLPESLPFRNVENVKAPKTRYKSKINPSELFKVALEELRDDEPECFKIFLLALQTGMRRKEIDILTWNQVRFDKCVIHPETTEHGGTKSDESESEIDVSPDVMALLKEFRDGDPDAEFVICSTVAPRPEANYGHYRCYATFRKLTAWLRDQGIKTDKPLHELRKEFGSQICASYGIYAASTALRHASIGVTREFYVDKKMPFVSPLPKIDQPKTSQPETPSSP